MSSNGHKNLGGKEQRSWRGLRNPQRVGEGGWREGGERVDGARHTEKRYMR